MFKTLSIVPKSNFWIYNNRVLTDSSILFLLYRLLKNLKRKRYLSVPLNPQMNQHGYTAQSCTSPTQCPGQLTIQASSRLKVFSILIDSGFKGSDTYQDYTMKKSSTENDSLTHSLIQKEKCNRIALCYLFLVCQGQTWSSAVSEQGMKNNRIKWKYKWRISFKNSINFQGFF